MPAPHGHRGTLISKPRRDIQPDAFTLEGVQIVLAAAMDAAAKEGTGN